MGAVLHVVVVVALAFLSVVECGYMDKTPKCKKCNWELTIKTEDNYDSGTYCDGQMWLLFKDGWHSDAIKLITTQSDFSKGKTEKFTFDVRLATGAIPIVRYFINFPGKFCFDKWQPSWAELRNKNAPEQVTGRCEVGGEFWVGHFKGLCCPGKGGKGTNCDMG